MVGSYSLQTLINCDMMLLFLSVSSDLLNCYCYKYSLETHLLSKESASHSFSVDNLLYKQLNQNQISVSFKLWLSFNMDLR